MASRSTMKPYLLLILLLVLNIHTQTIDPGAPTIISVSTSLSSFVAPTGSLEGGTMIYIKGTNFSPVAFENIITVGPYPCIISADGSKVDSLACRTTPATDPSKLYTLPVNIRVGNIFVSCNSNNCAYNYLQSRTPMIQEIIPRSVIGGGNVYVFGWHRITNLGDGRSPGDTQIDHLLIGENLCSMVDVIQDQDSYNPNWRSQIQCKADLAQVAGQYKFTELVKAGYARESFRTKQTSYFTDNNYTQRILPQIAQVSSHQGGTNGHLLTVKGSGFSNNLTDYSCTIADQSCTITQAGRTTLTVNVPPKSINNVELGALTQDSADNTTQTFKYLGGNGLKYIRYDMGGQWKTSTDWLAYLQGTPSLTVLSQKILTELSSPEVYGSGYLQYVKGYFFAPVDGVYRFSVMADDQFYMVMSTYKNNANPANLQTLLKQQNYNGNHFTAFVRANQTQTTTNLTLTAGYYYFQLVNVNSWGSGYFKVAVDMPSLRTYTANPTWQVDRVTVKPSQYDAEVINLKIFAKSGTFDLFYYGTDGYLKMASNSVGASSDTFKRSLSNLPNINDYSPTVTLNTLDAAGNPTNVTGLIEGYEYTLVLDRYRPTTSLPYTRANLTGSGNVPASISLTRPSTHSLPISGTFSLSMGGVPLQVNSNINIPYNVESWKLQYALNTYYQSKEIKVYRVMYTYPQDTIQFVIQYVGIPASAQPLTIDTTLLSSGKIGSTVVGIVEILREYSNRQLYTPVPYDFLYTASDLPSLRLSVKSIPAVCTDCSYQFNSVVTPVLASATRSGATYTLSVSNSAASLSQITISMLGVRCLNPTGTLASFTCTLPVNSDTTVALPAGTGKPIVHILSKGFAVNSAIGDQTVSISVASFSPPQTSPGGGIQATITGSGFPINSADGLSVQVCGNSVTSFTVISNKQIKLKVPKQSVTCSGSNNIISYNGQSAQFTFSYNPSIAPQIASLSKSSSSPILKSSIVISGSNFGTSATTKVYLVQNNDKKYELSIVTISATSITCILGGGRSGLYDVVVQDAANGMSLPSSQSQFSYKIIVSSLSISSGQKGGGYNLTITGQNFATSDGTNNVFIGTAKNSICKILSFTSTSIVCQVPRMSSQYTTNSALEVVVTGRVVQESVCDVGPCSFTYLDTGASQIQIPSTTNYKAGDIVTVTGTGLTGASVKIGGVTCSITTNTDTSLSFTYPALTAGTYQVYIKVANGWTYPQFISSTSISFGAGSGDGGSTLGMVFKVMGNGFPDISEINAWFVCSSTIPLQILSGLPTQLSILVPKYNADQNCKINVTIGTKFNLYNYQYRSNSTCSITVSGSGLSYTFVKNNMTNYIVDKAQFVWLDSAGNPTSSKYPLTISGNSLTASYLAAGNYLLSLHSSIYGFSSVTNPSFTVNFAANPIATSITSSFAGGKSLTISGAGFVTNTPTNNQITVCGLRSNIVSSTQSNIVISVPALVTTTTQQLYNLAYNGEVKGTSFGDVVSATNTADDSFNTIYSSPNVTCWVGVNFGSGILADITQIRYVPNPKWPIAAPKLQGALFQGSSDGVAYAPIFTVDTSQVHSGWNTWLKPAGSSVKYQYVRFTHNSTSACQLAEIKIYGIKYSTVPVTAGVDKVCDVVVLTQNKVLTGAVTYSHAATSVVTSIVPSFAQSVGGDIIKITGTGFGSSVTVTIDGVNCVLVNQTSTQIYCTTGVRSSPPSTGNSFIVNSDGNNAKIATDPFLYVDRWSNTNTWGGQAIPRDGDSVYVPKGMTLLVDQSTAILDTVIVEGKIKFQDGQDKTFDAHYFVINNGQFEAGTQTNPFQSKLTFTMYGGYFDKQLPMLGNKVIGCRNCKFNMHGKVRKTWTEVESTILPGATTFRVIQPVDWVAGEKIAVAATSYDHYQTEQMQIASVSVDKLQITVTQPFKYKHFAATQTFGTQNFVMRAQVGLLTRNIVVKGDDSSVAEQYGSHLMLTGKQSSGLVGKISYAEFTKCGQPKVVGRYCTHFHMAGQVPDSYVRGISVHHSFARVLTIHGTHFLLVEKNVGYHVKGHNIFVQDGIQTNNVIQDNLMMSSITSQIMLQSDVTVASYWITNPLNTVRRNHAAGGDFYGFWYQIKEHPDGPSSTSDICPMGMQVGQSKDNVAHSNRRFGLRIFKLSARKYPCLDTQDETALDPYIGNPPIHSLFENYTLWKNQQCGFLGEQLGYTTIRNFRTIDSKKGGLQFHKTNFTKQLVVAENCLVVGYSTGNAPTNIDVDYDKSRGVIASRTDGLKVKDIRFYNFGTTMTPLQSCSECYHFKLWVTGGKTTYFSNISYNNIQGKYIFWQKWRRQIFIDEDGSLTANLQSSITPAIPAQTKATISPFRSSLMVPSHCYNSGTLSPDLWDNSVYCDSTITLRGILFTNPQPFIDFNAIDIKANLMADAYENVTLETQPQFSGQPMIIIKKSLDIKNSWAMPFATSKFYNIHWKWGIDFTHMAIAPSRLWDNNDGVVLRFNYSDNRQMFQIGKWYQQQLQLPFITESTTLIDPSNCSNGNYFHDKDYKYLFLCVSGRNKAIRQWIDVNGLRCVNFCPPANKTTQRQNFSRLWSNVTQWPNQRLPLVNENVTIPYEWNLVLDIDPPILNYVEVNGILIFDRLRNNTFQAHYIWVKQGIIRIGQDGSPFTNNANIILHGAKNDSYLTIDPDASGNKLLAVTGGLEFYGKQPQTTWTRLIETALVNSTQIKVISAGGWKVGDYLVIAPSYSGRKQFEQVQITGINGNTISFTPALAYQHYGAATTTIENNYGVLDTRSAVGLLTRNIKISPGPDPDNWGCRVLVYGYNEISDDLTIPPTWRNGYAKLKGVQIDKCGQYDTTLAALRIQNIGSKSSSPNLIKTEVENTAIHGCGGFCTFIKQVSNVHINNNVYFYARKFIVYVEEVISQYNFTNNLLVGARKRDQINYLRDTMMVDDIAAYEQYFHIDFAANHQINVSKNLVQGSEGEGFVFPATSCDLLDSYPFVDNTAGSCQVAFMFEKLPDQTCLAAKGCIGYASQIGLMANMPGSHQQLIYSDMLFADNLRGITLRYAHEIDDNTMIFKNSYITGISRPTCTNCYGDNKISYCNGGYAVRMFTATISGQSFPLKKKPTGHDVICTQQAYDFKAFLNNVTFENYLYTNTQLPYCSNMAVFKRHAGASDGTASHHLTNTKCINCQSKSWAYFDQPFTGWRGWFGGCGQLDCTGPNNYLIHDQDGQFTGQKSQLLSNNSMIGDYEPFCSSIPEMNGHWCHTQQLALLQYESIAPDFNKRKMWPVYLSYDGGVWNSTTNGWKQWQWDGPEPMNLRLARFWSVIKLHKSYNLTYASQPPADSRFQIQKRLLPTGNANDWSIIRIYYPLPNSIQVMVKNTTGTDILVKPFPIKEGVAVDLNTVTNVCGANNFYYGNGTIQFVVNGIQNCQVRVRLSSYLQLSARIDIPISDFYSNNGTTSFITNICAFLGIDTGRMKIVGVYSGSTVVVAIIQSQGVDLNISTTAGTDPQPEYNELKALEEKLKTGLAGGNINLGGTILDYNTESYAFYIDGKEYKPDQPTQQSSKVLLIVLAVVIPVVLLGIVIAGFCYWKKRKGRVAEAELINNKSTINRETIKGSDFELSQGDQFVLGDKYKKWSNLQQHTEPN